MLNRICFRTTKNLLPALLLIPFLGTLGCDGGDENTVIEQPAEAAQAMEDYETALEEADASRSGE